MRGCSGRAGSRSGRTDPDFVSRSTDPDPDVKTKSWPDSSEKI